MARNFLLKSRLPQTKRPGKTISACNKEWHRSKHAKVIFFNQNIHHIICCGGENVGLVIHARGIAKALYPDRLLPLPTPTVHLPLLPAFLRLPCKQANYRLIFS